MIFPDPPMPERDELPGPDRPGRPDGPDGMFPPAPHGPEEPFTSSILHRLGILERQQRKVFGAVFSVYGLHPSQGIALKTIIHCPGMSQRELADRLRIQRATITVILQKLERGDFIRREPDPFDQRIIRIFPTQKGEAASRLTDEACNDFFAYCFNDISPEQQVELTRLLDQMEKNMFRFEAQLHNPKESCP